MGLPKKTEKLYNVNMVKFIQANLISLLIISCLLILPKVVFSEEGCTGADCPITLPNPIGVNDPGIIAGNIIKVILGLVGSISLVIFIYGGLLWMTSSGNREQVTKGRNTLIWATLGLLVIFSSYTIINFVLRKLAGQN